MALETLPTKFCPRVSASGELNFRLRKAQFGDGYQQVSGDGINAKAYQWNLEFVGSKAYIIELIDWLDARKGQQSFYWSHPLSKTDPSTKLPYKQLYRCESYKPTAITGETFSLSCTFIQAFAP